MPATEENQQIHEQFAAAWAEGTAPDIVEFIRYLPETPDETLRNELIVQDIEFCNQHELPMEAGTYAELGDDAVAFAETAVAARISQNRRIGFITLGVAIASAVVALVGNAFASEVITIAFGFVAICGAMLCVSPLQGRRFNETGKIKFSKMTAGGVLGCLVAHEAADAWSD